MAGREKIRDAFKPFHGHQGVTGPTCDAKPSGEMVDGLLLIECGNELKQKFLKKVEGDGSERHPSGGLPREPG